MAAIPVDSTSWTEVSSVNCRMYKPSLGDLYLIVSPTQPPASVLTGKIYEGRTVLNLTDIDFLQKVWVRITDAEAVGEIQVHPLATSDDPLGGKYTVTEIQNAIHNREAFFSAGRKIDLINGASYYIYGLVGAKQVHFDSFSVKSSLGGISVIMHAGVTVSATGTPITAANRFIEAVPSPASTLVYEEPTVTDFGNPSPSIYMPLSGTNPVHSSAVENGLGGGFVLASDTGYVIEIKNESGGLVTFGWVMVWHESDVTL